MAHSFGVPEMDVQIFINLASHTMSFLFVPLAVELRKRMGDPYSLLHELSLKLGSILDLKNALMKKESIAQHLLKDFTVDV